MNHGALPFIVLIAEEVPNAETAGGIILWRLLRHWPADRMVVLGPPPPPHAETLACDYRPFKPPITRLQFTRLASLVPPLSPFMPSGLPDIMYSGDAVVLSVMQTSAYYAAAASFARRHGLRMGLVVYDDPEEMERVRWWSRPLVRAFNRRAYRFADVRFCISPALRDALQVRYGADGDVLYPIRDRSLAPRAPDVNRTLRNARGLTIGFAGSMVSYGYSLRLKQLLPELRRAGASLRLYADRTPAFAGEAGVEFAGRSETPARVWERVKAECDAVILPYCGPDLGHQAMYRTHFPSKLPEYLALGMPVIVTGPPEATGMAWALVHPQACIAIESGPTARWQTELKWLRDEPDYREALARGAVAASLGDFDPALIERTFLARLTALGARRTPAAAR